MDTTAKEIKAGARVGRKTLGHAMVYLNEQVPRDRDAVEVLNKAWVRCAKEAFDPPPVATEPVMMGHLLPPLGDRTHHLQTEDIIAAMGGRQDFNTLKVEQHLHLMTSGQRYSLFRAVVTLVDERRAAKAAILNVASSTLAH
jgi:hypothetical protein